MKLEDVSAVSPTAFAMDRLPLLSASAVQLLVALTSLAPEDASQPDNLPQEVSDVRQFQEFLTDELAKGQERMAALQATSMQLASLRTLSRLLSSNR